MSLLFKMQKTLATFSLTLIFKVRILAISKHSINVEGYLISQNSHANYLITLFTGLLFTTKDMEKRNAK